jgi:hypothetical protein
LNSIHFASAVSVCLLLQVFLYVSLQKRVVGLAVVEPIKHAYKLAAPGEGALQQQHSRSVCHTPFVYSCML